MNDPANILIVEDEKHTRDGLRQLLEDDFEVYVAANAAEAMEHLQNDAIDLLLLLPLLCPAKRAKQQVSVVKPLLALGTGALVLLKRWVFNQHGGR